MQNMICLKESDVKSETSKGRDAKHRGFKKKGGKFKKPQSMANEFFKGVGSYIGREGPEWYTKTM